MTYDDAQRNQMLDLAVDTIERVLRTGSLELPDDLPEYLQRPGCVFVTLRRNGDLLGCVGALEPYQPLGRDIAEHAYAAAFRDPRFPPLDDVSGVAVEISVIGPMREFRAHSYEDLVSRIPRTGVAVEAQGRRGTYLPAVWEHLPDPASFMESLWRKAGLPPGTWPVNVWVYEVEEFERGGR